MDRSEEEANALQTEVSVKIPCIYPGCEVTVSQHLYQRHLLFCRKLYTGKYVRCQFSGRHLIPFPEIEMHEAQCTNQKVYIKVKQALESSKAKLVTSSSPRNTLQLTSFSNQLPNKEAVAELDHPVPVPDFFENAESSDEFDTNRFHDGDLASEMAAVSRIDGFVKPQTFHGRKPSVCRHDSGLDDVASVDGQESVYSEDYFSIRDHS